MTPLERSRFERLSRELQQWKVSALNAMDRYSDLLTAAGVKGHAFFTYNSSLTHQQAVDRLQSLVADHSVPVLDLSKGDRPNVPFTR